MSGGRATLRRQYIHKPLLALLLLPVLLLSGCGQSPPQSLMIQPQEGALSIPAQPDAGAAYEVAATLYFRYEDSDMLRAETRVITVSPNETRERALAEALLGGPASAGAGMTALFPKGTQVLSTQGQGDTLFITFNEALYDHYSDEPASLSGDKVRHEAALRRNLAMAALTASLTESGEYAYVQVLVRPESAVGQSMRLRRRYYLEDSDLPCDVLTRREAYLPTPANAARKLMEAWQARDWAGLYRFIASRDAAGSTPPAQHEAAALLGQSSVVTRYALTGGSVSPDGRTAVVCVDVTLRAQDGQEREKLAWPLALLCEGGQWKASMKAVRRLMELD